MPVNAGNESKVIPFPLSPSGDSSSSTFYDSFVGEYTHRRQSQRTSPSTSYFIIEKEDARLKQPPKRSIDNFSEAFFKIADANDHDLELAERSNCFDEWKELLELVARKDFLDIEHHQILGALIIATSHKDVSDFKSEDLILFQKATNTIRQPRINNLDAKRLLNEFLDHGLHITLPLAVDDLNEDEIRSLDDMMSNILKKTDADK